MNVQKLLKESEDYQHESKTVDKKARQLRKLLRERYLENSLTVANAYRELAWAMTDARAAYGNK
jgi:hypothetical protein